MKDRYEELLDKERRSVRDAMLALPLNDGLAMSHARLAGVHEGIVLAERAYTSLKTVDLDEGQA
jgi:hypothetical protein